MRRVAFIIIALCSGVAACHRREDTIPAPGWRTVEPWLSTEGKCKPCGEVACRNTKTVAEPSATTPLLPRKGCQIEIATRENALQVLTEEPQCTDVVIEALPRLSPDDLAAAYYLSADRNDRPSDLVRGWGAAMASLKVSPRLPSVRFNLALLQERLGLNDDAIASWQQVMALRLPGWSEEARQHRNRLQRANALQEWPQRRERLTAALKRGNRQKVEAQLDGYELIAQRDFEELLTSGRDLKAANLLADVLTKPGHDKYARALVDASARPETRDPLQRGREALAKAREEGDSVAGASGYRNAIRLLTRSNSPLRLEAELRYAIFRATKPNAKALLPSLERMLREAKHAQYNELAARIEILQGYILTNIDRYLDALEAYSSALEDSKTIADPTGMVRALLRRSGVYEVMGDPEKSWSDIAEALPLMPRVVEVRELHSLLGSGARAAIQLGQPEIALEYQAMTVPILDRALITAKGAAADELKRHLAIAVRSLAEYEAKLDRPNAEADLARSFRLVSQEKDEDIKRALSMREFEVMGRSLLRKDPAQAAKAFDEALRLSREDYSTLRAALYKQRAEALRLSGRPVEADEDLEAALSILKKEGAKLLASRVIGQGEERWSSYFSRFRDINEALIRRLIEQRRNDEAFLRVEEGKAFEPLHLILHSRNIPREYRQIAESRDVARLSAEIPPGTFLIEYLVMEDRTYAWIVSQGRVSGVIQLGPGREQIRRWARDLRRAVHLQRPDSFDQVLNTAFQELVRSPLERVQEIAGDQEARLVFIPDDAMHGLPFAAMKGTKHRYLAQEATVSYAASTKLYIFSRMRDRAFQADPKPSILLIGNPQLDPRLTRELDLDDLPGAVVEVREIGLMYAPYSQIRTGAEATVPELLRLAKTSTIVHIAAHGVPNEEQPLRSMLLLAPSTEQYGTLTSLDLMKELGHINKTRLVILAACSSAGGVPVGPEGVAPLVRPLIAAGVPAVVGTLWDVSDATAKDLLVSFHRHYREGSDVAEALTQAQRELLRNTKPGSKPAMSWAPFQVIGYARSPFESQAPLEDLQSVNIHHQDSLQRSHGVRPE